MSVIVVIAVIIAVWFGIAVLLALFIGRAIRIADRRQAAQLAMRPRRVQVARAR